MSKLSLERYFFFMMSQERERERDDYKRISRHYEKRLIVSKQLMKEIKLRENNLMNILDHLE